MCNDGVWDKSYIYNKVYIMPLQILLYMHHMYDYVFQLLLPASVDQSLLEGA